MSHDEGHVASLAEESFESSPRDGARKTAVSAAVGAARLPLDAGEWQVRARDPSPGGRPISPAGGVLQLDAPGILPDHLRLDARARDVVPQRPLRAGRHDLRGKGTSLRAEVAIAHDGQELGRVVVR